MTTIHSTAIIDKKAELDVEVTVDPYAIIGPNVKIGKGTRIQAHAVVKGHTTIGKNNQIGLFNSIGATPQDLKYKGETTYVEIGDNNSFREYVTVNRGTVQDKGITKIGNHCLVMAYCHVAHDCSIHDHVILANCTNLAGHITIEDYATIGGMVGITQYLRLGKYSYTGGSTTLEKDLLPYCIAYGNRAKIKGVNIIGLKRRGFTKEQLQSIVKAHEIFFNSTKEKSQLLEEMEKLFPNQADVQYFLNSIRNSKRGITK